MPPNYDYDQLYPNRFVKSGLLQGKAWTVRIADVLLEELEDRKGKRNKPILILEGLPKDVPAQFVAVKTNGECLRAMFGRNTGDWKGKRIVIYSRIVSSPDGEVPAIRIFGSPDIAQDIEFIANLGRKHPKLTMRKTDPSKKTGRVPPPAPTPEPVEMGAETEPTEEEQEEIRARELEADGAADIPF